MHAKSRSPPCSRCQLPLNQQNATPLQPPAALECSLCHMRIHKEHIVPLPAKRDVEPCKMNKVGQDEEIYVKCESKEERDKWIRTIQQLKHRQVTLSIAPDRAHSKR